MTYICKFTMSIILLVEKSGSIKELATKSFNEEELYKKAGFKSKEGFECATTWAETVDDKSYVISLYGKNAGRAGQENKYDFPPPVDNVLFFGTCVLISRNEDGKIVDLNKTTWLKIYEQLFGGFEDLDDEEEEDASEDDTEEEELPRTKEGYVKDGFIVDEVMEDDVEEEEEEEEEDELNDEEEETEEEDEEELDDVDEEDEEEEEEEESEMDEDESDMGKKSKKPVKKPMSVKKPVATATKKIAAKTKKETERVTKPKSVQRVDSGNYLNCSDELKEESYV